MQCAYLFCEGDVLEKNGSAGSVKYLSHFGLQTLACMKSTCNGPVSNNRLQAFRVPRLFAAPLDAGRMAQPGTEQHRMSTACPFVRWGVSAGIAVLTLLGNFRYNSLVEGENARLSSR